MYTENIKIRVLKDRSGLNAGDIIEAKVWLNMDSYEPVPEFEDAERNILLGQLRHGGWEYYDKPRYKVHRT